MRRLILWLLVLIVIVVPLALAAVSIQTNPSLPETAALSPKPAGEAGETAQPLIEAPRAGAASRTVEPVGAATPQPQVAAVEQSSGADVQDPTASRQELHGSAPPETAVSTTPPFGAATAGVAGASQRPAGPKPGSSGAVDAAAVRLDAVTADAARPSSDAPEAKIETVGARLEATPRVSAPETPPAVTRVEAALRRLDGGEIEIRLDPPELGRVRMSLASTEAGLVATVLAERPEAADMLRRHAETLARSLAEAGHEEVTLHFGSDDGGQAGDRGSPATPGDVEVFGATSAGAASAEASAPLASAGLDLRV